jgi:hypothetical protein
MIWNVYRLILTFAVAKDETEGNEIVPFFISHDNRNTSTGG